MFRLETKIPSNVRTWITYIDTYGPFVLYCYCNLAFIHIQSVTLET